MPPVGVSLVAVPIRLPKTYGTGHATSPTPNVQLDRGDRIGPSIEHRSAVGYDPARVAGAGEGFDTKFGLYQPETNAGRRVYFDDVRFATTLTAAGP
jgi:hypothetical protein